MQNTQYNNLEFDLDINDIITDMPGFIYWKDLDSVYRGCNLNFAKFSNFNSPTDIVGKMDSDFAWAKNSAADSVAHDKHVITTGNTLITEDNLLFENETRVFRTEKRPLMGKSGKIVGIFAFAVDITSEKQLQQLKRAQALQKNEFEQIINLVDAGIYWKDLNGRMLGCNQFILDMFGVSNKEQVLGKNEDDLVSPEDAIKINQVDQSVIKNGRYVGEETFTVASGKVLTFLTVKNQLSDNDGNVIGLVGASLDITAQKEAEQRALEVQLENERQQRLLLQEQEKFAQRARKVSHDIKSPLFALKTLIQLSKDLPEEERLLLIRATDSILDISNNLIANYSNDKNQPILEDELRQPVLVSDLIVQLLSEKKMQYRNHDIQFELDIDDNAQFTFVRIQRMELRRALSNLINNAVDASIGREDAIVVIKLEADEHLVDVWVIDDGGGMSEEALKKMQSKQSFTEGKEDGHGLGLRQVWDMLEYNQGLFQVQSFPNVGTLIQLTFPRVDAAEWIIQTLTLNPDQCILILDDEKSIHSAWELRFAPLLKEYPKLKLHHFTQGNDVLEFCKGLSQAEKDEAFFLSDYELLRQDKTGLEVIEASQIKQAVLVTSHYADQLVQHAAAKLAVKILPKQLASVIPIDVGCNVLSA